MSEQPSVIGMVLAVRLADAACNDFCSIGFCVRRDIERGAFAFGDNNIAGLCVRLLIESSASASNVGFIVR